MSTYAVIDPATGEQIKSYPEASDAEIENAVAAAARAYSTWSRTTTVADRTALVRRVGELHSERRAELAAIIGREMGKDEEASLGEVDVCRDIYDFYADHGEELLADQPVPHLAGPGSAVIRRSSFGVLLGIMPWNYPYYQVARFAAPNLVTGNPILLKHAPQCPESAAALQEIFTEAGFPAGAYVNIYATNDQVATIIADPRVSGVSLTGSARAGAAVAELAGRHLKKVVLELGGSDPFVLLGTDDLDAAVEAATQARLDNTGQACNAAKRFIVTANLYDEFIPKFTERMLAASSELPPLSSVRAAETLEAQVERAVTGGAQLASAGNRSGGHFPSGVLTGVTADNPVFHEELFGPVAMVFRVASEDEAVELANDTPFGLGSYVFTNDPEQAARVADRLDVGMVFVNGVGMEGAELPFGGVKASGFGRELGTLGIEEFVNKKVIRTAG
jgi:succinate-semialdehyde dehydrogenase / glutarate-semialdehyde dehydrogenase